MGVRSLYLSERVDHERDELHATEASHFAFGEEALEQERQELGHQSRGRAVVLVLVGVARGGCRLSLFGVCGAREGGSVNEPTQPR